MSEKKKMLAPDQYVSLKNDSPVSRQAVLSVGGIIIPFYKLTMEMSADDFVRITAEVPVSKVDVLALQKHTEIKLVEDVE